MKILNLVYPEQSDIKYQLQKFPDGQQDIVIIGGVSDLLINSPVQIKSRLNNAEDLLMIVATTAALYNLGIGEIHLYVPYFLGSRSDRKFVNGGVHYLKDVVCPIINSLKFKSITVLDSHSDVLEACLNNFRKFANKNLVRFALADLYKPNTPDNFILVSPDGGSLKKIYKLSEQIGYNGDIAVCEKSRDIDGKLTNTYVPVAKFISQKDIIIIDDIIDGGKTFIDIVKQINKLEKHQGCTIKKYLICTHGIFSKGFGELQQYFDYIYTTNSYQDLNPDTQSFVKQLNVY